MVVSTAPITSSGVDIEQGLQECSDGKYHELADCLYKNKSHTIYRRFGYLLHRLLLQKQDELANLELNLRELGAKDALSHRAVDSDNGTAKGNGPIAHCEDVSNPLLVEAEKQWLQYSVLVQSGKQLLNMDRVTNDDWNSKWSVLDGQFSTIPRQMSHLRTNNDIISLAKPADDARIDKLFLYIIYHWLPFSVGRAMFGNKMPSAQSSQRFQFSRSRVNKAKFIISMIVMVVLQLAPIWLLWYLTAIRSLPKTSPVPIVVILVADLIFFGIVAAVTNASRQEIIGASAAYCAVLLVFLSSSSS